jgi:Tol biopolymer transport system component
MFSASRTGTVAYHTGQNIGQLVWVDRNGKEVATISRPSIYEPYSARLSRDDSALLASRRRAGAGTYDIWQMNLVRGNEEQLTLDRGSEVSPVWMHDGRSILFAGDSPGSLPHLFRQDLATRAVQQVLPPGNQQLAMDAFPDGRAVAYVERGPKGFRMFRLPLAQGSSSTPLPSAQRDAHNMRLSLDGRAMTFVVGGDEGRMKAYVSSVQVTSGSVLAAEEVASPARWSRDGRRIYYVSRDGTMMTVPVATASAITVGTPEQLFKLRRPARLQDVALDGRFLLLETLVRADQHPVTVWTGAIAATQR